MIARTGTNGEKGDIWAEISAPLPAGVIAWRQDGRAVQRDGKYLARFVAYIESNTVRERLDNIVPGEWDLTLDLLPAVASEDADEAMCAFKARLQVLGVIREDVGTGRDYKQAATDAFKRVAVRFGIGHELYSYEQNWVQVDGDGKYAKPLEDPADAYARRHGRSVDMPQVGNEAKAARPAKASPSPTSAASSTSNGLADGPLASEEPSCPKCGGRMWDNRISKRNPKAPDFKCRASTCDGVVWPARKQRSEPDADEFPTSFADAPDPYGF